MSANIAPIEGLGIFVQLELGVITTGVLVSSNVAMELVLNEDITPLT